MLQDTALFSVAHNCKVSDNVQYVPDSVQYVPDSVQYVPEKHIAYFDLYLVQVCLKDTQAKLRRAGCHQYKVRPAVTQQNTRVAQRD